jgi:hypothetical protein
LCTSAVFVEGGVEEAALASLFSVDDG